MPSNALSVSSADSRSATPKLLKDQRIQVRIGINLDEVIVEGADRFGEGVNIAARSRACSIYPQEPRTM